MHSSSQCYKHHHCHHHQHHHHHHHHHHHLLPHCPIHSSQLTKLNLNLGHFSPFSRLNLCQDANFKVSNCLQAATEDSQLISEGDGQGLEAEDEVEYAFVLTDEWKEFFAKSEAKRRLAKKQEKRKRDNRVDIHKLFVIIFFRFVRGDSLPSSRHPMQKLLT